MSLCVTGLYDNCFDMRRHSTWLRLATNSARIIPIWRATKSVMDWHVRSTDISAVLTGTLCRLCCCAVQVLRLLCRLLHVSVQEALHDQHVRSFCTNKSSRSAGSFSSFRHHSTSLSWTQLAHATQQEVEPLLLIRSSGPVIYGVLGVGVLSLCCSVFVLTNLEGVPSGAPVAACDDHGSYIIFSHVAQCLPIAPRTTSCTPLHVYRMLLLLGGPAGVVIGPCAAAGSALSWTPRVSGARITKYGRAPTDFGGTSAATLQTGNDRQQPLSVPLPCTLHVSLLLPALRWVVLSAVHGSKVTCRSVRYTVDTLVVT